MKMRKCSCLILHQIYTVSNIKEFCLFQFKEYLRHIEYIPKRKQFVLNFLQVYGKPYIGILPNGVYVSLDQPGAMAITQNIISELSLGM